MYGASETWLRSSFESIGPGASEVAIVAEETVPVTGKRRSINGDAKFQGPGGSVGRDPKAISACKDGTGCDRVGQYPGEGATKLPVISICSTGGLFDVQDCFHYFG